MPPRPRRWHIAVIGGGKVGSVLGRILADRGNRIVCVVSRTTASARRAGRYLGCRNVSTSLAAVPDSVDLIFITTPHAAVAEVAAGLAALPRPSFRGTAVCHASGMLTADVLDPVRRRGATVFSFHPLQTFPRDFTPDAILGSARGIWYGIDGRPRALTVARELARRLEGRAMVIPPDRRAFYHAACVVASNHLTALMNILAEMFTGLGRDRRAFFPVFEPIIAATLRNVRRTGPAAALSGPVARGGIETVDEHFRAVRRTAPHLFPYFAAMTLETVRLARLKGSIDEDRTRLMVDLVLTHIREHAGASDAE
jgi:predicted short-subunit dehydrogenase-like oxidoreductase (DUF2520 family)